MDKMTLEEAEAIVADYAARDVKIYAAAVVLINSKDETERAEAVAFRETFFANGANQDIFNLTPETMKVRDARHDAALELVMRYYKRLSRFLR